MTSSLQKILKQSRAFSSLEEEVWLAMMTVSSLALEPWARYLRQNSELTHVQYNVLRILRGSKGRGLTLSGIAERMITKSPDITRMIDRLEQRGLVERRSDDTDRRVTRVHIRPKGLEALAKLDEAAARMPKQIFAGLERSDLEQLRHSLDRWLQAPGTFP